MTENSEKKLAPPLTREEVRRLHEIEGNPFTDEDEAMFDMFEREGWSTEQQLDYIKNKFAKK
ncbi:hypothetical protein [Hyphobacterium sp.]|uniref:hypothetical protein n=1 Tax=Hyphobacterium sp. TaxID=2004662 RepID=UPI003BAD9434